MGETFAPWDKPLISKPLPPIDLENLKAERRTGAKFHRFIGPGARCMADR